VDLIEDVENLLRHHQHPEGDTVTDQTVEETGPAQGESIAEEAEDHVKQLIAWGQRFLSQGLPAVKAKAEGLAAELAALQGNPVVKLLEGLAPEQVQVIAGIVERVVAVVRGAEPEPPAPEAPAEPEAPADGGEQPQ
jgi:hypothetical protein